VLQLSTWLASASTWILASSLKGAILIGLVLIVRRFLTPATASRLRYALWLPVLLGLLCPIGPSLQVWSRSPGAEVQRFTQRATESLPQGLPSSRGETATHRSPSASQAQASQQPGTSARASRSAPAERGIAFAWAGVALILGLLYLRNLGRYSRIVHRARPADPAATAALRRCEAELCLPRNVRILESDDIDSPSVFGWWRPALLLPAGLCQRLDAGSLRLVVLHELVHVKANDVLVNWVCALTQMLHWFNPAVWLAMRCVRRDMEHACDARVLAHLSAAERRDYGNTLVHLADSGVREPSVAYGLGIADRHSDLKERLIMIAHLGPASNGTKLTAGLALLGFTSLALTQPLLAQHSQDSATKPAMLRVAEGGGGANSATGGNAPARASGIPLETLVQQVAANIHRRVIVDPRAHAPVMLYGQKLDQITYSDFLTILRVNGMTAVDVNDYINVVRLDEVRTLPLPTVADGKELPADQFADMSIVLKNACAPQLIPILRPWLPFYAYIAADLRSNSILAIDTYANLERIRGVIKELDARTKPGARCGPPSP
jgi:beta-lactamase regulating signal transducer with metallopeptidase domain